MKISAYEIYKRFLDFFQSENHLIIKNSSIIPDNDPTLLFINSGMAPIKKYFTGEQTPDFPRLCNVQTCIRTIDIDSIGDDHHLTSFQMLGNWAINDYFKREAINFAYKFVTENLNIDKNKLYVTVFSGDKKLGLDFDYDSEKFWIEVGIPKDRIVACGREDNFWGPTSETGPCGPCTEIFYDTGRGEKYSPGGNFDTVNRYIEIWNAGVFMQFNKNVDGSFSKLNFVSVDAGAGLERMTMALNGFNNVYDTDLLAPIMQKICENLPKGHNVSSKDMRILTDHLRTSCIILSEKIKPSNEGRGYILRRLIRKCVMITSINYIENFCFEDVLKFILGNYSNYFKNFSDDSEFVLKTFLDEEKNFKRVLKDGFERLSIVMNGSKLIDSNTAFEFVTTYGLPFEFIKDFASRSNMEVDEAGFYKKFSEHREISKKSGIDVNSNIMDKIGGLEDVSSTEFLGYDNNEISAKILKIFIDNNEKENAFCGDKVALILDKTSLYAESGGQCADFGEIFDEKNNFKVKITDVKKNKNGVFMHFGEIVLGKISIFDEVKVKFDVERRKNLAKNHSCVHLLQAALRKIFGKSVAQTGSKVEEERLRFDFNFEKQISNEQIFEIERMVNEFICENICLKVENMGIKEALNSGAMALFESKYGETVRVVSFGDVSKELCGGTHTSRTGDIGMFVINSVEGIGKGIKRITGLTGIKALKFIQNKMQSFNEIVGILKTKPENAVNTLKKKLQNTVSSVDKIDKIQNSEIEINKLSDNIKIGFVTRKKSSKVLSSEVRNAAQMIDGILICLAGEGDMKKIFVSVSKKINESAKEVLHKLLSSFEGKGGGNDKLACGSLKVKNMSDIKKIIL